MPLDYAAEYRRKLTTPENAVSLIPKRGNLSFGLGAGAPPELCRALAERARAQEIEDLNLYYQLALAPAAPLLQLDLMDRLHPRPNFITALDRALMKAAEPRMVVEFTPSYLWQLPRIFTEFVHMDAFMITVSPMDRHGYFSLGTSNDYASSVARDCELLLLEVNENMPRVFGDSLIHVSEVDAIVEHHAPLVELIDRPAGKLDEIIGRSIVERVPDGATLQLGIGGIPNAMTRFLTNHKELGIHTEMLTSGVVDLYEAGAITNSRKNIHRNKTVFTLCCGDRRLYDFINDNPAVESYPASHINDPAVIAMNDNVVSINSVVEVDLFGQVNSEYAEGHELSGVGGQRDFVSGAFRSKGGQSFLAFYSTAKQENISKIVPRIEGLLSETRMETMWLVTEYGMCNLKGKSIRERALAIIELAHPKFREDLLREAKKMGLVS
ncbi:MAG: acetyl-CoA hydrolase/transferase C-terminal domain-containing protein [Desulforhabdus sp.]|jgi:itaconate CoA-transferase|nr:acetyl-CoA hydrolase/transferase C-terminal domain-containing protein [Desulforhabdus sp.]